MRCGLREAISLHILNMLLGSLIQYGSNSKWRLLCAAGVSYPNYGLFRVATHSASVYSLDS